MPLAFHGDSRLTCLNDKTDSPDELIQNGCRTLISHPLEIMPFDGLPSINTLVESRKMIRCVRDLGIQRLLVVAPPFQQLRAFMTAVTVALEWYPELKLYSSPGMALPWMDTVVHSQGTLQAPRRQLIKEELVRIETYQKKGDLARFKTVLNYIDERDR